MELCGGGCITDIFQYEQVGLDEPLIAYLMQGLPFVFSCCWPKFLLMD